MAILHKNINNETDIHNPKWFQNANNGDYAFKNEKGQLESTDELLLPAALNFVDGSVAPPTTNAGDIYILSSGGSVNAGWGGVSLQDWVRYDGAAWNSITPQKGSMCYDKNADALKVFDGSAWAGLGSSFGKLGISDSAGAFTYYSTLADALTAASSGDTIEFFANITETSNITVTCVDGVNINFNGYTYTLNTSGTANAFSVNNNVSLEMYNGKIKRTGATSDVTTKVAIKATGLGILTLSSMILENDFGNAAYLSSPTRTIKGGVFVGETKGIFLQNARLENAHASSNTGVGLQIQNNGIAINCYGFSDNSYGIYNNNSQAHNCTGRSHGNHGFFSGNGQTYNCQGFSSSNYGFHITGDAKYGNIFGYSSAEAGVNIVGQGTNVTGYSTATYGVRYFSGSGDHLILNLKAFSTADVAMYVLKNSGKVEFSNLDCATTHDDAGSHALLVAGSDDDIFFSGGSLRVQNAGANCINAASAKNCYFVGLRFSNSTTPVNANITNLQSNTEDTFGNISIG
jgi:hypothetical protein|tara:strand:+ start:2616 stop:4166 length:1551 start_codon:yes stop_codon:yes gene_type:complete